MTLVETMNRQARRLPPGVLYLLAAAWAAWLFYAAVTGASGPDPVAALTDATGILALQLLLAGLAITPLRRFAGINLLRFRRAVGLCAFFFAALHFTIWLALDLAFRWGQIAADLAKRPFIMLGFAAFLILLPLAITSNNAAIRWLGAPGWQRLHRLTYAAVLLGAVHYLIGVKVVTAGPLAYVAAAVVLVGLRLIWLAPRGYFPKWEKR